MRNLYIPDFILNSIFTVGWHLNKGSLIEKNLTTWTQTLSTCLSLKLGEQLKLLCLCLVSQVIRRTDETNKGKDGFSFMLKKPFKANEQISMKKTLKCGGVTITLCCEMSFVIFAVFIDLLLWQMFSLTVYLRFSNSIQIRSLDLNLNWPDRAYREREP